MTSSDTSNKITEITRSGIIDAISLGPVSWSGRLEETAFLSRLFDLENLPSTDRRYATASMDIWQHRVMNSDWSADWVFYDPRFNIFHGPDEQFLRFICEMVHPVVRPDTLEVLRLVKLFNDHLVVDGWEIFEAARISNKPVFAARPLIAGASAPVRAAKEIAFTLDGAYVGQQITRMEAAIDADPELAIGTAKEFLETVCKTLLSERGTAYGKDDTLPKLVKLTIKDLELVPGAVQKARQAAENVRVLLMNLAAIGHHVAELRNPYGTGHGKEATHSGLESKHARLVVGAATTLGVFLFECQAKSK